MMKQFIQWTVMMVAVLSLSAYGSTMMCDDTFGYSSGGDGPFASVHSWVTYDDVDTYTYYYRILDVSDDYQMHYFQFDLPDIATSYNLNKGQTTNWEDTYYGDGNLYAGWYSYEADDVFYGMGAIFTSPVAAGKTSIILHFDSDLAPIASTGMLNGFDPSNQNISLNGNVYTPVPEPATVLLLAMGTGYVMHMKRRTN